MVAQLYIAGHIAHIAHMRKHRHHSKIVTFQERQMKFSIYIISTYEFTEMGPLWGSFLRA